MDVNEMRAGYGYGDYLSDIGNVSQEVRHGMWALTPQSVGDGIAEEFAGGGGTKYTTDNDVSSDGFPTYNNIDTSPSIRNDLDANSSLYNEDLEYKHVDDATADEFVISENIQKMDKEFVKTGYFTDEDRANILEITNGDNYTYDVAKLYDFYMQISNPNLERGDAASYERYEKPALIERYNELRNYDRNVIPIKDKDNIKYGIDLAIGLSYRQQIVDFLKSIPSVYLRNLKQDIRQERTPEELNYGRLRKYYIPTIRNQFKNINRLSHDKKEKIYNKIFSSKNDTFEKVAEQMEKLDVLFLHHDDGIEELMNKVNYEAEHGEAEMLYEGKNVVVVSIKSSDAMKNLGCGSQWCFATEYSTEHWKDYSHNTNVNIVYNFNKNPESRKRMVVILANGGIYDTYNEYMDDGDEYLAKLGVSKYINAGKEPALDNDEVDDDYLHERKKAWIPGSQSVEVKRECQLGGLGDGTSKACNQGDINNLVFKTIKEFVEELNEYAGEKKDKYLYDRYKLPREFGDFDEKYEDYVSNMQKLRKVFNNVEIYVNPHTLGPMKPNVRAVLVNNGDLYVANKDTLHPFILTAMYKNGVITKEDFISPDVNKFIFLIRKERSNVFELSSSQEERNNDEKFIQEIFNKAKVKVGSEIIFQTSFSINENFSNFVENKSPEKMLALHEQISSLQELPFRQDVENLGGKIYSVGGAVRDEFLGKESKDLDVLITGVSMDDLEEMLSNYGRVDAVGKSFGVLKFRPQGSDEEIDIAIPRTEKATGEGGHKGFDVTSDHELPIEQDLLRRDFTINAIAKDVDGNVVDPYNGREDLQNKIIRVVNPDAFAEDPLRMLRAVQFASRFGFTIEPKTMNLIKENASRIKEIPAERILIEFDKIVVKGDKWMGAQLLAKTGLYQNIFGVQPVDFPDVFHKINTMGEFIFAICKDALNNCADFYKNKLKGEINTYKEIKAYEMMNTMSFKDKPYARSVAHNMYLISPQSLKSLILPIKLRVAADELLEGKYPKTVNELAVSGNDLMQIGLKGKQIGDMQKKLLLKVYVDKVKNNKENLLTLANENMSSNELSEINLVDNNRNNNINKRREDKPIQYSGVILDETSRQRLLRAIKMMGIEIPEDWKIIAHHVTIASAQKIPSQFERMNVHLGLNIAFTAVSVAMDDMVIAVGVEGVESLNEKPHITIAVNRPAGAKPVMSNNLTNWIPLKRPLRLVGKVEEVEFKG